MWRKWRDGFKKLGAGAGGKFSGLKKRLPTSDSRWVKPIIFYGRRWGMKMGFELLKIYWFIARPEGERAKCLIVHQGHVLLIRHTYGPNAWTIPGGNLKRGELPVEAARREVKEEVGIELQRVFSLGKKWHRQFHKEDTIHFFFGETWSPDVKIDDVEIAEAKWFGPLALPYPIGETALLALELFEEFEMKTTLVIPRHERKE